MMRIVNICISNFRGIQKLDWCPFPRMNCLVGPGDSTKTTILDAIELTLNPRTNFLGDDTDFYNLNLADPSIVTVTLVEIPDEFCADNRYGLFLRGWDEKNQIVLDEPGEPKENVLDALSIRVEIDPKNLEGRWSIYNDRLAAESDPPSLRFKDAVELATTRLGPYAERHLGWGRQSVLNRIGEGGKMNEQLAAASRAAREAFQKSDKKMFAVPTTRAEKLGKRFSVPVRKSFTAELDVTRSAITSGGVTLHDGDLPLRTLGTGSSRLVVAALQHNAHGSHIALVDEIENGLEPHRIAQLLKYLLDPSAADDDGRNVTTQIFLTTHSEVVIRELRASDIQIVRCKAGETKVLSATMQAETFDNVQRYLRSSPGAFLARRIIIGEGKTECGLLRGLDVCWEKSGLDSFALLGIVPINGGGIPNAISLAQYLVDLGYHCLVLLDSDEPPSEESVAKVKSSGGTVVQWPDNCSTEQRIFFDAPWDLVRELIAYAAECHTEDSVLAHINNVCSKMSLSLLQNLTLPKELDSNSLRSALGLAAKGKKAEWFKRTDYGEHIAGLIYPYLSKIQDKPFSQCLDLSHKWIYG